MKNLYDNPQRDVTRSNFALGVGVEFHPHRVHIFHTHTHTHAPGMRRVMESCFVIGVNRVTWYAAQLYILPVMRISPGAG